MFPLWIRKIHFMSVTRRMWSQSFHFPIMWLWDHSHICFDKHISLISSSTVAATMSQTERRWTQVKEEQRSTNLFVPPKGITIVFPLFWWFISGWIGAIHGRGRERSVEDISSHNSWEKEERFVAHNTSFWEIAVGVYKNPNASY